MLNEELQKYITEYQKKHGSIPSLEMLNQWMQKYTQKVNSSGLSQFEGFSSTEMSAIIQDLWSKNSPIKMRKLSEEDLNTVPLYCQIKYITDYLLKEGQIKLTATKAIPPKIVKEVYKLGIGEWMIDKGYSKLTKETDSQSVVLTHVMLNLMKVTEEQKGVMTLTKKGETIAQDNQKLFEELLKDFTCQFNLAYFDGYENDTVGGIATGFSLFLLWKYGNEKRSYEFYAEKYFKAFPGLLKDFGDEFGTAEDQAASCYSIRTFEGFMIHFGLIEKERIKDPENEIYIKKSKLFDKMIQVFPPKK